MADVTAFAEGCDAVTFDHEHVPAEVLAALEDQGRTLNPTPAALVYAQDKLAMRRAIDDLGLPNPRWAEVRAAEDLVSFGRAIGWPVVLKTPRGGYDGKGVMIIRDADSVQDAAEWFARAQREGATCWRSRRSRSPGSSPPRSPERGTAPSLPTPSWSRPRPTGVRRSGGPGTAHIPAHLAEAERIARAVADRLDVTGMLAVELFEVAETGGTDATPPGIYVNELAMRPHNSGHWTMDGSATSQFEQHLRAVLGLPLGATDVTGGASGHVVMKNLLGGANPSLHAALPAAMQRSPTRRSTCTAKTPSRGERSVT